MARGAVLVSHGERLADDLAFAAEVGLQQVRLDVSWAAAKPRAAGYDGSVLEQAHGAATLARSLGLQPWFRLLQADVPHWFDDEGGFADARNAGLWWPRWVELAAGHLGEVSAGWVPFEAPYAMALRMEPTDARKHGELMHQLVVAWRDAWRILRGGPPVATALDVAVERPLGPSQHELDEARRRDQLRWGVWLGGLADGMVRIPGRADREVAELAGACDIVGLAVRSGVETALHRAAEQGPERPLAVTFRPEGATDTARADSVAAMWRDVRGAGSMVAAVTITPFIDDPALPDRPGIATAARVLKDAGHAFLAPG
ncbi:MAG: family 1 glycosylhydrolase [Actinomycetota bacterium]|nr:family 1 glycosylhydrolase [Actinomycetota bacterium]